MKQIKTILFAFGCSFLLSGTKAFAQIERLPDEASYPVLQELPGVETPAVLLSGTWQFQYSPDSKWDKIQVPGEPAMQGYAIEHDKPFTYRSRSPSRPITPASIRSCVSTASTAMPACL